MSDVQTEDKDAQIAALTSELQAVRARRNIPVPSAPHINHTVTSDEALSGGLEAIGEKYNVHPDLLYAHNTATIEGNATARGFQDSEGGRLLWPGTVLRVPVD